MKPVGGYFSLELAQRHLPFWLSNAVGVNSSRHALEYILKSIPNTPNLIYLPYYTCEVVLEPINRLGIKYQFYHINDKLEIESFPAKSSDEIVIVNNYFGIKDNYINSVLEHYGNNIIVDNAQAFYHIVADSNKAIYSPRKFFGVPDGGYALTPYLLNIELPQDYSADRTSHLLKRLDAGAEAGYADFQKNDFSLSAESLSSMSNLTRSILASVDYKKAKCIRRKNFATLHSALTDLNKLNIPNQNTFECPMVYPFLTDNKELRKKLIQSKIFVATYWPNVFEWCNKDSLEYLLTECLIPLPIDQRYDKTDMDLIVEIIKSTIR